MKNNQSQISNFTGKELVVKDIGFMQAAYHLDVVELRLVAMAIIVLRKESQSNDFDFTTVPTVTLHASLYADLFGTTKNNAYMVLSKAADELMERKIQWVDIYEDKASNKKADRKNKLRWVSKCSYVNTLGVVQITFSPDVLPFLAHIHRHFATYEICNLAKLKTPYEFRLYELGVAWKSSNRVAMLKKQTLRERLGILDANHLADSSNFQRMLKSALKTVNKETDLDISLEPVYTRNPNARGRYVSHYKMTVVQKSNRDSHLVGLGSEVPEAPEPEAPVPAPAPEAPVPAPEAPAPEAPAPVETSKPLCVVPDASGNWDWDFIIENLHRPNLQIIGLNENDVPDDVLRKTKDYQQYAIRPEFDALGLGVARVAIIRCIVKMPPMAATGASVAKAKKRGKHGISELSNDQKQTIYNNKAFQSKYAPVGVSDWNVISRELRALLDGDLTKIPDLLDYIDL